MTDAEVVVIGSGPAGAATAETLVEAGTRVVMLETGQRPERDRFAVLQRTLLGEIPWRFPPYSYEMHGDDIELNEFAIRMLGGSSLAWGGITPRFHESDFRMKSRYGVGFDWPLAYQELEPFYCRAEAFMGVSGNADNEYISPRSRDYPMPAFPMNDTDLLVKEAGGRLGIKFHSVPVARNSRPYKNRSACILYSTCRACPVGALYGSDRTVAALETKPNFRLLLGAEARRIELSQDGRVGRVVYLDDEGREHAVRAQRVVIATQAVEAVRLLLNSACRGHRDGLSNGSGALGLGFMEHAKFYVLAKMKSRQRPYRQGFETCTTFKYHDHASRDRHAGGRVLVRESAGPAPFQIASESGKWGRALRDEVQDLFGKFIMLGAFMEQLPYDSNRVRLSEDRTHAGTPAARVEFRLIHAYERAGYKYLKDVIINILEATGVTEICTVTPALNSGHYMGGHRMGANADTSITDSYLESHEVPGLFLATAGAFPTGGVSNPTLTTVALCLRMADRILGRV